MARKKVSGWIWGRQEYLYQSKVYEYESGGFDPGPPASPVVTRVASPEDLERFGVRQ